MKRNYVRIDFENCATDYDYTICDWSEVESYCEGFRNDLDTLDEIGYAEWKNEGYLPIIKLSIVQMTEDEYGAWFKKNVKP